MPPAIVQEVAESHKALLAARASVAEAERAMLSAATNPRLNQAMRLTLMRQATEKFNASVVEHNRAWERLAASMDRVMAQMKSTIESIERTDAELAAKAQKILAAELIHQKRWESEREDDSRSFFTHIRQAWSVLRSRG